MQPQLGQNYLITTDDWFYAPDSQLYKAVYGKILNVLSSEQTLGVKTNAKSTNWYVVIGNETEQLYIAGCQIHYAMRTDVKPYGKTISSNVHEGKLIEQEWTQPRIYIFN